MSLTCHYCSSIWWYNECQTFFFFSITGKKYSSFCHLNIFIRLIYFTNMMPVIINTLHITQTCQRQWQVCALHLKNSNPSANTSWQQTQLGSQDCAAFPLWHCHVVLHSEFLFKSMHPQFTCKDLCLDFTFLIFALLPCDSKIERNLTVSRFLPQLNCTIPAQLKNVQWIKFSRNV